MSGVGVESNDHIYALDASMGELLWRYETGDDVSSSPVVADDVVNVRSNDNYVYAIGAGVTD